MGYGRDWRLYPLRPDPSTDAPGSHNTDRDISVAESRIMAEWAFSWATIYNDAQYRRQKILL
jgi:hypothetical protein